MFLASDFSRPKGNDLEAKNKKTRAIHQYILLLTMSQQPGSLGRREDGPKNYWKGLKVESTLKI